MALRTLVAQLAAMRVAVAERATRTQAHKRLVEILDFDFGPRRDAHTVRVVAGFASQRFMFAGQRKIGELIVIEFRFVELRDRELPAIVFLVAAYTIALAAPYVVTARVVPLLLIRFTPDFHMAFQTLESLVADPEVVTSCALRRALQMLVGASKGSRGDLCSPGRLHQ